jgi:caa(3)-type oxidase subunit IV
MTAHTEAHAHPHRNYVKIWAILVGLLVVSVTGPMLGIRVVTLIAAFGVALVKAYMVAKNFMHLDVEKPIVHWLLAVALTLMVLLYAGVSSDVQKDSGERWRKNAGFHPRERAGHVEHAEPAAGAATAAPGGTAAEPAPSQDTSSAGH